MERALPWLGLTIGLWAVLPPYVGPELANLSPRVEIADHVVPAVLILVVSVLMLVRAGRSPGGGLPLISGFLVALAGLWMVATHLPLVKQAVNDEAGVTVVSAAWHTVPGVVVMVLGAVWVAATWSGAEGDAASAGGTKAARAPRP